MKKFREVLKYIFVKPLTGLFLYLGNEKYIKFCNKHPIIKVLYSFLLAGFFFFVIFVIPWLMNK